MVHGRWEAIANTRLTIVLCDSAGSAQFDSVFAQTKRVRGAEGTPLEDGVAEGSPPRIDISSVALSLQTTWIQHFSG